MENNLTLWEAVNNDPRELVARQTPEQQAQTYIMLDILTKALKDNEKEALLNSGLDKFTITFNNGITKTLTVVKTEGRVEDVVEKTIDYDKAVAFAKEHNFEIPMTTPQVDKDKLEGMEWFQNNVEMFVKKEIKQKAIKPTKAIRVK